MKNSFWLLGLSVAACVGCAVDSSQLLPPTEHHAPPAAMMQHPGPMVDGPGPGVLAPIVPMMQAPGTASTTQVRFIGPIGMDIGWKIRNGYAERQMVSGQRYNFPQGTTYRLKFSNIADRDMLELYPTLQVYPAHPTTDAYLAHNSVPVELNDEDLDQVESNNFVTKVIYLPDEKFQEFAIAGVETLVSTRLDPGVDPIAEADRRGTIMVVMRVGNMDLEMPGDLGQVSAVGHPGGNISLASHQVVDGKNDQFVPPLPIGSIGGGIAGVPNPMIVGNAGHPGMPAFNPVSGAGGIPSWGQPITGTPIGLPGPPHLPLGGPAGLQSHTIRNLTKTNIPGPVDHMLIETQHKPGLSLPKPVKYIRYNERHPSHSAGEVAHPSWALPQGQLPPPPASGQPGLFH